MEIRRVRADEGLRNRDIRIRMLTDASDAFGGTLERVLARPEGYWHEAIAELAAGDRRILFVADDGNRWQAVAGGVLDDEGRAAEVIAVWVDPAHRGTGVAKTLITRVLEWARGRGAERAYLWVHVHNPSAVAFYERLGFEREGATRPLGDDGTRIQMLMTLELQNP